MASIAVTVNSTSGRPEYCTVVITNCDTRYADTKRQRINNNMPVQFIDVPSGRYYIVVVPEGEDVHQAQFRKIDKTTNNTFVTFDLTATPPVGRITATVLVGGQLSSGDIVTIQGRSNNHYDCSMTDIGGEAVFQDVPENETYDITVDRYPKPQTLSCTLSAGANCNQQFLFQVCSCCNR